MGTVIPSLVERSGGRPPLRLNPLYGRWARLAWSGAEGSDLIVPYDYSSQERVASTDATPIIETDYLGLRGFHRTGSATTPIHMRRTTDTFNSGSVNVAFHALIYVDLCGTNNLNYRLFGCTETTGNQFGVGILVNTNGVGGFRVEGGVTTATPYLPKAKAEKKLLSIVAYEVGQTIGLIVNGELIGTTTHAWPTRDGYPATRIAMTNASGTEPVLSVIQYASFFAEDMSMSRLVALSADPTALWSQPSRFVPSESGGGEPSLTIAGIDHGHTLEAVTLSTAATLSIAGMSHAHTIDAPTLSADMTLAVAGMDHGHTIDNVVLDVSSALTVADMEHGHPVEAPTLTADMTLAAAGMEHQHTIESPTLSADMGLVVAGVEHASTIDNVDLDTAASLTVADLEHSHTVESPTLSADMSLTVADAAHALAVDNVVLTGSGGLWTPADITTAVWFDADDATSFSLTGSDIDQWNDKSGNARHATPPTGTKPTRTASGINAMGSVVFGSGADPLLTSSFANPSGADGLMVAMVLVKTGEPVNFSIPVVKGAVNTEWSVVITSGVAVDGTSNIRNDLTAGNTATSSNAFGVDSPRVLSGVLSSASIEQYFTGIAEGTQGAASRSFSGPSALTLGSSPDASYAANRFQGQIGELVVVHADVTSTTRQLLEGYLAHKWGLESQLPAEHPYKAAPPGVGESLDLTVADTTHAHTVDALTLSADLTLIAADTTHAHTIDAVALSADLNLAVADTIHAHTTDNLVLESSEPNLTLAGVEHAHTIDNVTLQAAMSLVVAGMEHPHTIDNITLSAALDLIVAGMEHPHTIDAVELVLGLALTVQNMTHAHTVAGLTLEAALSLAINGALHGHTLDAVALEIAVTLLINDVLHTHTIDGPVIYLPTPVIEELRRSVFARVVQLRTFARVEQAHVFAQLDNSQVFTRR